MVNEMKRGKFIEIAEGRVQNVIHALEIIVPMGRSDNYDYTEEDVDFIMNAIQEAKDNLEKSLRQRFDLKSSDKKVFSFSNNQNNNDVE